MKIKNTRYGILTLSDGREVTINNLTKIKKTKRAIEREEYKIKRVEQSKDELPQIFFDLVEKGLLNQWRKHPNVFFVNGVDKARIGYDKKTGKAYNKFFRNIECDEQKQKFKDVWSIVYGELNDK